MGLLRQAAQRVHTALGALLEPDEAPEPVVGTQPPVDEFGQLVGLANSTDLGGNVSQIADQLVAHPPANADEVAKALTELHQAWIAKNGEEQPYAKAGGTDPATPNPRGYTADPRYALTGFGYVERPGPLSFDMLRSLPYRVSLLADIVQTRVGQMSNFCTPQVTKFEPGFRITTRDRLKSPTSADKREIDRLTDIVLNSGRANNSYIRPGYEALTRACMRDSYTFDQVAIEMVKSRDGKPAYWRPLDAGSIRLHRSWVMDPSPTTTKTVQVIDMRPVAEWGPDELIYDAINNRTDMRSFGYGFPEAEMVFTTITHFLWGINHNAMFFKQGTTQPGILNLKGKLPKKELRAFRRFWYTLVSGNANAWRTPILNAEEGIDFVSLMKSNADMEWSAWLDFLIKVVSAAYGMDPIEINFKFGNSGGGQKSMFGAADRAKTVESKEKGLRPRLTFWARVFNENMIWPLNPDFMLEPVGLMSMTPKEYADLMTQRVRSVYKINEARAELDLPPDPDGDVILDANFLAHKREKDAAKVQQEQFAMQHSLKQQQLAQQAQQSQAQLAAKTTQAELPPGGNRRPDQPTPAAPPSPAVGSLPGDPQDAQQIAELEALLQPKEGKKVQS